MGQNVGIRLRELQHAYEQMPQYIIIGLLSVAINLIVFWITNKITEDIYISTLLGNLASITLNFTGLYKLFKSNSIAPSVIKYLFSLIVFYFLSVYSTIFLIEIGLIDVVARAIMVAIFFPIVYLVNKYLVFA